MTWDTDMAADQPSAPALQVPKASWLASKPALIPQQLLLLQ